MDEEELIVAARAWIVENFPLPAHLLRTEHWLLELFPEADGALRLAALLHDVDRAFPPEAGEEVPPLATSYDDQLYLAWHSGRSAHFASRILASLGAEEGLARRVADLVLIHEKGGPHGAEMLMEADSISFLENNVGFFLREIVDDRETVLRKVRYMFGRIRSGRGLLLATPVYEGVVAKVNGLEKSIYRAGKGLDAFGFPKRGE